MKIALIIGLGGFFGSIGRYLASKYIQQAVPVIFPYGTLTVNILGSFLIGIIFGIAAKGTLLSAEWRMFLAVGFCGGFTTFSSFSNDSLNLLRDGQIFQFLMYGGMSVFLGLFAVYLGYLLAKTI